MVKVNPGHWIELLPHGFVQVYRCSAQRCAGTDVLSLSGEGGEGNYSIPQCSELRSQDFFNWMCGKCLHGYQDIRGKCEKCDKTNGLYLCLALMAAAVFIYAIYFIESRKNNTGSLGVVIYYTQIALLIAGPTSSWMQWVQLFSLSVSSSNSWNSCLIKQGDIGQNLLMPFILLLILGAVGTGLLAVIYTASRVYPIEFKTDLYIRTACALLLFNFTAVVQVCMHACVCVCVYVRVSVCKCV
jgi:hypothetical protein